MNKKAMKKIKGAVVYIKGIFKEDANKRDLKRIYKSLERHNKTVASICYRYAGVA